MGRIPKETRLKVLELYLEEGETQEYIAKELGICRNSVRAILHESGELMKYKETLDARKLQAEIIVLANAPKAARKMVEMIDKPVKNNMLYIQQNAARDILDRNGMRAKDESKADVTISFTDGALPDIGMPDTSGEQAELSGDDDSV